MSPKNFKILVSGNISEAALKHLKDSSILTVENLPQASGPGLEKAVSDAHGLIVRTDTLITRELLEFAPLLKLVCRAGTGVDHIDVQACLEKKITIMNTPEANRVSAAEHTLGLLLALAKKIPQATASLKSGRWDQSKLGGIEISQKTLGIIGLGNIGQRVATRAHAFGMNVVAFDPYLEPSVSSKIHVKLMLLKDVLEISDFVTLHVPLNDETKNMVNKNFLSLMRRDSFLINASRGPVVNEGALIEFLKNKKLQGAALDVFENEPLPPESQLLNFENVILTPHIAGKTKESQLAMSMDAAVQVRKFFEEGISSHVVLRN